MLIMSHILPLSHDNLMLTMELLFKYNLVLWAMEFTMGNRVRPCFGCIHMEKYNKHVHMFQTFPLICVEI